MTVNILCPVNAVRLKSGHTLHGENLEKKIYDNRWKVFKDFNTITWKYEQSKDGIHQKNKDLITWLHFEYEQNPNTEKPQVQLLVNSKQQKQNY